MQLCQLQGMQDILWQSKEGERGRRDVTGSCGYPEQGDKIRQTCVDVEQVIAGHAGLPGHACGDDH